MKTNKELEQAAEKHSKDSGVFYSEARENIKSDFIAGANWQSEQDNWISLAINPPEKPDMVLGGHFYNNEFLQDVFFYDGITKQYFTHWQPLPKKPLNKSI